MRGRVVGAGEQIPGSRFYRVFCATCGEPMRVVFHDIHKPAYCEDCAPRKPLPRPATKDDDAGPWHDNAIRAMEDNT